MGANFFVVMLFILSLNFAARRETEFFDEPRLILLSAKWISQTNVKPIPHTRQDTAQILFGKSPVQCAAAS